MALTEAEIRHVARLVRLELSDAEVARLGGELSTILEHVSKISTLELADVPPTSHPLDIVNVFAADEPVPSLSRQEALASAPDPADDGFRVPPIGA